MGMRYRKSIKIAPGVKLNVGKKSAGISVGGKYGGMSFNSKTGARARTSIPGTGISYSEKIASSSNSSHNSTSIKKTSAQKNTKPVPQRVWFIIVAAIFLIGGLGNIGSDTGAAILGIIVGAVMLVFTFVSFRSKGSERREDPLETEDKQ